MKIEIKKSKRLLQTIGFSVIALAATQTAVADWTVQGNQILDPNGNPFVYRGVNLGQLPTASSLSYVIEDIAKTGANAIRIPVDGMRSSDAQKYVDLCKKHKLVCVFTNAAMRGYGDAFNSPGSTAFIDTWIFGLKELLQQNTDYVVIDVASGPAGNGMDRNFYVGHMELAIQLLRLNGINNQLIIDGANWGQDWDFHMRDTAEYLRDKDPLKNIVFNVHMFEAYNNPATVRTYLHHFVDRDLPIIVGEFGPVRRDRPMEQRNPYTTNDVAEDEIMAISRELGVGYLGWTWSGSPTNYADLNMVTNFDPLQMTAWGNKLVNGENGIKQTAKPATHFENSSSSSSMSSSSVSSQSDNRQPYAVIASRVVQERCGSVYAELNGKESTDADGDTLSYAWTVYNPNNYSYQYFTGSELKFYMRPVINYQFILDVEDGRGGKSTAVKELSHSYSDNCMSSSASSVFIPRSSSSMSSERAQPLSSSVRSTSSSSMRSSSSFSSRMLSCPQGNSWPDCPHTTWNDAYCKQVGPYTCPRSWSSASSSSVPQGAKAMCSYHIQNQWNNGFTAAIRIKNISTSAINGWSVNWQYTDGSKITNLWNANFSGANPYTATNLNWNTNIQPGQTVEFGFQGSKSAAVAVVPVVNGTICQ